MVAEKGHLGFGLDALGHHVQLQPVGHDEKSFCDRGVFHVARDPLREGLVDLERVERKVFEIVKRRVAGSEIVHRETHAHLLDFAKHIERLAIVLHDPSLGELELPRAHLRFFQYAREALEETRRAKFARRDIDGDPQGANPLFAPAT